MAYLLYVKSKEKTYMKKLAGGILVLLFFIAGVAGCKKVISAIFPGLEVDVPAVTVTIPALEPFPGAPVPNVEIPVGSFTQGFNLDSIVRVRTAGSFNANDVTSVQIKQITFDAANADEQNNLSNFKSVRFTFSSNNRQDVAEIGSINFPDSALSTYVFVPTAAPDIRPYLNGSQLSYNVYGQLRRYTKKALKLTTNITVKVK
jgi:hypothetical protein